MDKTAKFHAITKKKKIHLASLVMNGRIRYFYLFAMIKEKNL